MGYNDCDDDDYNDGNVTNPITETPDYCSGTRIIQNERNQQFQRRGANDTEQNGPGPTINELCHGNSHVFSSENIAKKHSIMKMSNVQNHVDTFIEGGCPYSALRISNCDKRNNTYAKVDEKQAILSQNHKGSKTVTSSASNQGKRCRSIIRRDRTNPFQRVIREIRATLLKRIVKGVKPKQDPETIRSVNAKPGPRIIRRYVARIGHRSNRVQLSEQIIRGERAAPVQEIARCFRVERCQRTITVSRAKRANWITKGYKGKLDLQCKRRKEFQRTADTAKPCQQIIKDQKGKFGKFANQGNPEKSGMEIGAKMAKIIIKSNRGKLGRQIRAGNRIKLGRRTARSARAKLRHQTIRNNRSKQNRLNISGHLGTNSRIRAKLRQRITRGDRRTSGGAFVGSDAAKLGQRRRIYSREKLDQNIFVSD